MCSEGGKNIEKLREINIVQGVFHIEVAARHRGSAFRWCLWSDRHTQLSRNDIAVL